MDVVIPIVFPDYLILAVERKSISVPDLLPGIDLLPNTVKIPDGARKLPYLGHAGVLFLSGRNGVTKYYEYGRYDPALLGLTRKVAIPDVKLAANGKPTKSSLIAVLSTISRKSGQNGRILGVYIELKEGGFEAMTKAATRRVGQNANSHREPYSLTSNSCAHFSLEIAAAGGAKIPKFYDPRPASIMDELQADYPDVNFTPPQKLTVKGIELGDGAGKPGATPTKASTAHRK